MLYFPTSGLSPSSLYSRWPPSLPSSDSLLQKWDQVRGKVNRKGGSQLGTPSLFYDLYLCSTVPSNTKFSIRFKEIYSVSVAIIISLHWAPFLLNCLRKSSQLPLEEQLFSFYKEGNMDKHGKLIYYNATCNVKSRIIPKVLREVVFFTSPHAPTRHTTEL